MGLGTDPMKNEAYSFFNFSHTGIVLEKENMNQLAADDKIEKIFTLEEISKRHL